MQRDLTIYNVSNFNEKIAQVNKKLTRYGISPVKILSQYTDTETIRNIVTTPYGHKEIDTEREYTVFTLEYNELKLGDYRLIASINHVESLVNLAPVDNASISHNEEIYYLEFARCEHCNIKRQRNDTFIIEDTRDKSRMQIGRNCLSLYVGYDAANCLQMSDAYMDIADLFIPEDYDVPISQVSEYTLLEYLAAVDYCIDTYGWMPSTGGGKPTKYDAIDVLKEEKLREKISQGNYNNAVKVIDWMKEQKSGTSTYARNLYRIACNLYVTPKSYGYAASAMQSYNKEYHEQSVNNAPVSKFQGKIKQRLNLSLACTFVTSFDTMYDVNHLHLFVDTDGNVYKWVTGAVSYDVGDKVSGKGTVKSHDIYNSVNQTTLVRCKFEIV